MTAQSIGAIAGNVVNRWAYYQEELKYPGCNERDVDHDNICGYYRLKGAATKPDYPVGIYPDDSDQIVLKVGRRDAVGLTSEDGWDFRGAGWLKCAAVEYAEYMKALEEGVWSDGKAARKEDASPARDGAAAAAAAGEPAGIGHNSGDADPFEAIKIELLGEVETAKEFGKTPITTEDQAEKVSVWRDRIKKLRKKAGDVHKVQKEPWLEGGRVVDAKKNDLWAIADDGLESLNAIMKPFLQKKARAEEERQRKARAEADRLRREAEERRIEEEKAAAEALAKTDIACLPSDEEQAAAEAEREARRKADEAAIREAERAAKAQSVNVGRTGAKTTLRKEKYGVVDDYEKAALALVRMKHSTIIETIDQLANRAAKADMVFDGMHADVREVL